MELGGNRAHGTEMEWPIVAETIHEYDSGPQVSVAQISPSVMERYVTRYLEDKPYTGASGYYFLGNGSRFYRDIGDKRETTTPEHTSYLGTTASQIANERMMYDIVKQGVQADREQGDKQHYIDRFAIFNQVVDDSGKAWGYHESYNVPVHVPNNAAGLALHGLHLATRNIIVGAGFLHKNGHFYSAQKATQLFMDFLGGTTNNRPVVNLRNEPHSNARTRRVHVISGDPSMSPWANRMKLGMTSIVLEMAADGMTADDFDFKPLQSTQKESDRNQLASFIRELAADSTATSSAFQEALRQQKRLFELAAKRDLTAEQAWTVEEGQKVCAELERFDLNAAARRGVEWVMRKRVLERTRERHGLCWSDSELRKYDRRFGQLGPNGIGTALRETAWAADMPPESMIQQLATHAPETTRAVLRGKFIQAMGAPERRDGQASADWSYVKYQNLVFKMENPYQTTNEHLDNLIALYAAA